MLSPRSRRLSGIGALRSGAAADEFRNAFRHILQLLFGDLGIYGQGESFGSGSFAVGKCARLDAQISKALLHVHGHRIINFGANSLLQQKSLQLVAALNADYVLVKDVAAAHDSGSNRGKASGGEKLIVLFRITLASGGPTV